MLIAPKGFGKCVVAYTAIKELTQDDILKRVLVISTAQVCRETWAKESEKWAHLLDVSAVCITGENEDVRDGLLKKGSDIVICNFELLPWLVEHECFKTFDGLLIDEITKLKSVGGVGFKKLRKHLKNFTWRVGMSADPVAQDSEDIYGQMLIIDQGRRLGRNKDNFRRKYFMQTDYKGYTWDFQPGGRERLVSALSDIIYTVDAAEYEQGLPELIDYEVPVKMPDSVREHYRALAKDDYVNIGDCTIEAPNAAVAQAKLHQMCNGAVYYHVDTLVRANSVDESSEEWAMSKYVLNLHDAKMAALDMILDQIKTPVLIAYEYDFQRLAIVKKHNFPVFSAKNSKKKNDNLLASWDAGTLRGMLVHAKSAGHGLNLQNGPCSTLICMTYFWSADQWDQLIGRIRRRGQKSDVVTRYTIVCEKSVEDVVMKPRLDARDETSLKFHEYLKDLKK